MPARLKSLELLGYKTFANKTVFEFAEAITAIVGPNGSGKSNIADSLRWVLGEQSYSLLRGKKTEDMIFSGSELRPRSGMAAATITFDNSDSWLPIDFSEVAITRRAYRDGDNEYLINGQRVRLKDISELLAQSGLAERTYTIIGQGLVDAALALKAEDRRKLFEEAAGIGLFRSRREEALRRLEITQHNLERVEDILVELEPRLRSLERQAKRAQEYEQVKTDLQVLLREWYGYHWHHAQQELKEAREADRVQTQTLNQARADQVSHEAQLGELRKQIQTSREQLNQWLRQSGDYRSQREALNRDIAVSSERIRSIQQQIQSIQDEISRSQDELSLQTELLNSVEQDVERLEGDLQEAASQGEIAQKAFIERQRERQRIDSQVQESRQKLGLLNTQQGQIQARILERSDQIERDRKSLESVLSALEDTNRRRDAAEEQAEIAKENLSQADSVLKEAEQAYEMQRRQLAEADEFRRSLQDEVSKSRAELERVNARREILIQAEKNLSGYSEGARRLLTAIRQGELKGKPGSLNQFIEVPGDLEQAISAALGEFADAAMIESDLEDALLILENDSLGGSVLPLSQLKSVQPVNPELFGLSDIANPETGWIGVASDLVQTTTDLRQVLDILLGSVWVVRDRHSGRSVLNAATWSDRVGPALARLRIVTLNGEIIYPDGPAVAVRSSEEHVHSLLSRQRQLHELEETSAKATLEWEGIENRVVEHYRELEIKKSELARLSEERRQKLLQKEKSTLAMQEARLIAEQAAQQAKWQFDQMERLENQIHQSEAELTRLTEDLTRLEADVVQARETLKSLNNQLANVVLDEFQAQANHWNTQIAVTERALNDEQRRLRERKSTIEKINNQQIAFQSKLVELECDRQAIQDEKVVIEAKFVEIGDSISTLEQLIKPAEKELSALDQKQSQLERLDAEARQAVSLQDHRQTQTHGLLVRRQETLQSLQRRIEEDFGLVAFDYAEQVSGQSPLPLEGMVEQLPRIFQLAPEIEDGIKRQRAQLRRIGPINPEAQEEYKAVFERYNFMTEQIADLHRAEIDIREVVQELDELMKKEFNRTFDAVAAEFKAIFQRLFGGGLARLVLTDPDNLADTGIDIEARLPGRRTQGLSLLSGGERSLTATSLVFALLKVSPTPFCVLDEVDAMLDEANVGRFRDLLRELSQRTQFIIVTHNRNTVQAADVIYGVTMGRDSTSQTVSLRMDQVASVFE